MRSTWLAGAVLVASMGPSARVCAQVGTPIARPSLVLPTVAPTVVRLPVLAPGAVSATPAPAGPAKPAMPAAGYARYGVAAPVPMPIAVGAAAITPVPAYGPLAPAAPPMPAVLALQVLNPASLQLPSVAPIELRPLVLTFDLGPAVRPVPAEPKTEASRPPVPIQEDSGLAALLQSGMPGLNLPSLSTGGSFQPYLPSLGGDLGAPMPNTNLILNNPLAWF